MFNFKYKAFFLCGIFCSLILLNIYGIVKNNYSLKHNNNIFNNNNLDSLNLFSNTLFTVQNLYYKEISIDELLQYATKGIVEGLDNYSYFISENHLLQSSKSYLSGIGLNIEYKNNQFTVISPITNSPAFKAGIKTGDIITHINSKDTSLMNLKEISKELKGKKGTKILLDLKRNQEVIKLALSRDNFYQPDISVKIIKQIGYIKINYFDKETANIFKKHAKFLSKQDIKGIIIDVRNNPGGFIDEAIKIADSMLDQGEIILIDERYKIQKQYIQAKKGDIFNNLPMVLIINQGTSSAAEILTGALQEQKRALIIGKKSYGKALIQSIIKIDNNQTLKLTTGEYLLSSGKSIEGIGIVPDIEVSYVCQEDCKKNSKEDYQIEYSLNLISNYRK